MTKPPLEGMDRSRAIAIALQEAHQETLRAAGHWPPFHSVHEGFGVLLEEVDELKWACWRKEPDPVELRKEAIHVAAMALRFAAELTLPL